jgi:hypothetical protein
MSYVRLASWKQGDGAARADELRELGFKVVFEPMDPGALIRKVAEEQPSALVIDLTRSPALGRDVGIAVRVRTSTRTVPLVFVGGPEEKVAAIGKLLPDAWFSPWEGVAEALRKAVESPLEDPIVPDSAMAGYSGTPLPKKLGIKSSSRVLLVSAPAGFSDTLGGLPAGATLTRRFSPSVDLILWFVRSRRELDQDLARWKTRIPQGGIWIIWPKTSSGVVTDLRQGVVRGCGLAAGLVDYKIASVDSTWSGLKFSVRKVG